MELIWKELDAVRLMEKRTDNVRVDGMMHSPDGRTPAAIVLASPHTEVLSSIVDNDGLHITGRITVMLICEDGTGGLFSYESTASFKHDTAVGCASQGVSASTSAQIVSARVYPDENGALLESEIELTSILTSSVPVRVTGGISGVSDLEMKTVEYESSKRVVLGTGVSRMREELASEAAEGVLYSEGQITVRDVAADSGAAAVSGTLTVSAAVTDRNGRPSQLIRQIPFREKIGINGNGEKLFCDAKLKNVWLRALGEDFGIISLEAEVEFTVFTTETHKITLPVDAFSPTIGFGCLSEKTELLSYIGNISAACNVKETIPLPEMAADVTSPLFAGSRALVTGTERVAAGIAVNGLTYTTVVYESSAGALHMFSDETPFSLLIEGADRSNTHTVNVSCVTQILGTGERCVSVQNAFELDAELYLSEAAEPVVGLAETELTERKPGIILCFASEGEDEFDIAKRYSVPCALVQSMNPESKAPYSEGERLMIMK